MLWAQGEMSYLRVSLVQAAGLLLWSLPACSGEHGDEFGRDMELDLATIDGGEASEVPPFDRDAGATRHDAAPPSDAVDAAQAADAAEAEGSAHVQVRVVGDGEGRVLSTSGGLDCGVTCESIVTMGSLLSLRAEASAGSHFVGYRGASCGVDAACDLTVDGDLSITAEFAREPPPASDPMLTVLLQGAGAGVVRSMPGGVVCPGQCGGPFASGSTVVLTAEADTQSSEFVGWGGACSGREPTCELILQQGSTAEARFERLLRNLTVSLLGDGGGSVRAVEAGSMDAIVACGELGEDCDAALAHGAQVELTASVPAFASFRWGGACEGESATTCKLSMTEAREVTLTTNLLPRTLTVNTTGSGAGVVTGVVQGSASQVIRCGTGGSDCSETVSHGAHLVLTALPSDGSSFAWSGACEGVTSSTCTVAMTEARSVTATFSPIMRTLGITVAGNGAGNVVARTSTGQQVLTCSTGTCTAQVAHGTAIQLTATPVSSRITWSGACNGTGASCPLTLSANRSATLTLIRVATLRVSFTGGGMGRIRSLQGSIDCAKNSPTAPLEGRCEDSFDVGTSVTLEAEERTPECAGESSFRDQHDGWSLTTCAGGSPCSVPMTGPRSVSAEISRWGCVD